ncbi:MAG TPA: 50S ribosomal protein L11 methyltransferase [Syntrophales bacterium]|nr:50S ribosomal protein L11 methyltransferase [Syntrophales bacterium]
MPGSGEKTGEKKGRWLKIELSVSPVLVDAVSNFVTEIGAEGVLQEESEQQFPDDFEVSATREVLKAYLPFDIRLEHRIASLRTYLDSLIELFPGLEEPLLATETVMDQDWGEEWKKYFKPLRVSKNIIIKPTWERYAPTGRDIVIEIDPGMAFGTGQHPSTRMCLEAIEDIILKDRTIKGWKVLDVGTGTGILGISCAKLGAEKVVCVDIDKKAAEIARENAKINHVEDKVAIINRDVTTVHESFDLIVANLTAKILMRLRTHLLSLIGNDGYLVISGIIDQNKSDIELHFLTGEFALHHTITEKEWICYILQKRGA